MKNTVKYESNDDTNCNWCFWYSLQRIDASTGEYGNKSRNRDHPNYSIVEIGQNTEKSPRDLKRLVVTHTPVKNHRLTQV